MQKLFLPGHEPVQMTDIVFLLTREILEIKLPQFSVHMESQRKLIGTLKLAIVLVTEV